MRSFVFVRRVADDWRRRNQRVRTVVAVVVVRRIRIVVPDGNRPETVIRCGALKILQMERRETEDGTVRRWRRRREENDAPHHECRQQRE